MPRENEELLMGLRGLIERELRGDEPPSRYEVIAGLTFAVRVIERQSGELIAARAAKPAAAPAAAMASTAEKHRHEFGADGFCGVLVVDRAGGPPEPCGKKKSANGRPPKVSLPAVDATVEGGGSAS